MVLVGISGFSVRALVVMPGMTVVVSLWWWGVCASARRDGESEVRDGGAADELAGQPRVRSAAGQLGQHLLLELVDLRQRGEGALVGGLDVHMAGAARGVAVAEPYDPDLERAELVHEGLAQLGFQLVLRALLVDHDHGASRSLSTVSGGGGAPCTSSETAGA